MVVPDASREPARVALVGRFAVALARAHTEASLAVATMQFLESTELAWVELVLLADGPVRVLRVSGVRGEASRPARPFALPIAKPLVPQVLSPRADAKVPELRRAHERGVRSLLVLPLHACEGADPTSLGQLLVALRRPDPRFDGDTCIALADVASAALASCRTLARVGELSRRAHVDRRELRSEIDRRRDDVAITARSSVMRRLVEHVVPQAARHDVSVLLLGESGVGKELLAHELHRRSLRAQRPMLAINCGGLPESIVDSTLFGHEAGAFTGAVRRQSGLFERAHRGTLFLDEVGELSPATQAKLLRVLDRGELERVGSASTLHVDVRIIAATNRDLTAMVDAGTFRLDLYHRLALAKIAVPPLRERREDIDALVPFLLQKIARRTGTAPILPTPSQMRKLRAHPWPGNVRELENTLARALLFTEKGKLALEAALEETSATKSTLPTFAEASRRSIEAALAASGGRIHGAGGAAAILKLKPTTLKSKMLKLGVARAR